MGDKGYLGAFLQAELATVGIDWLTPLRANRTDSRPLKCEGPIVKTEFRGYPAQNMLEP